MQIRLSLSLLASLWLSVQAGICADFEYAAWILTQKGKWQIVSNEGKVKNSKAGDMIPTGSSVKPAKNGNPNDAISIVLRNGEQLNCTGTHYEDCCKPFSSTTRGSGESWFFAILNLFKRNPERYGSAISKTSPKLKLSEAVIALDNSQLDLAPVFAEMPEGKYKLALKPISTRSNASIKSFLYDWQGSNSMPALAPRLQDGLYEVSIKNRKDDSSNSAWVLISTSKSESGQLASDFQKAVTLSENWSKGTKAFKRASLDLLEKNRSRSD